MIGMFLGNELHDKLNAKYIKLITQVDEEISELTKTLELLKNDEG